jgi:general secretion pathway protein G
MINIRSQKGFSFIEIMVIIVIIGLILGIAMPNYLDARIKARKSICQSNQKIIYTAATMYLLAEPVSLEALPEDERLQALIDGGYVKGRQWCECPVSVDKDYNDYEIIFEDGIVADVECKEKPQDHVWP